VFQGNLEDDMAVKYNKLFHMMIEQKISNAELARKAGVSLNIITRLKRDEYLSLGTIEKLCVAMRCTPNDMMEFVAVNNPSEKGI
jgi:DNA-binding Xre family transcriptional regulator